MSNAWRVELDRLRSDFEKLPDNLHHLLVEMDGRHRLERGEKYVPGTDDQDDCDPECRDRIGTPPLRYWLSSSELEVVRSLSGGMMTGAFRLMNQEHFFEETYLWSYDGRDRRHIFHGLRDSWEEYRRLARKAAQIIWRSPDKVKELLPEFAEGPWFDPFDRPSDGIQGNATPEQYWTLGLHRLAWRKQPGSPLWANRFVWGTGLLLPLDGTNALVREEWRLIGFDPSIRRERPEDTRRRIELRLDFLRWCLQLLQRTDESAREDWEKAIKRLRSGFSRLERDAAIGCLRSRIVRLERELSINRDCASARQIARRHKGRLTAPPDFFFSALCEEPSHGPGALARSSVLAIELVLDLTFPSHASLQPTLHSYDPHVETTPPRVLGTPPATSPSGPAGEIGSLHERQGPEAPAGRSDHAMPPSPAETTGRTEHTQGNEILAPRRKRRRKGEAKLLLASALESLVDKGQWGKTNTEIIDLAGISGDSFYRLIKEDDGIKRMMEQYGRESLGRGPVRADEL
jgi:hypothetical protein